MFVISSKLESDIFSSVNIEGSSILTLTPFNAKKNLRINLISIELLPGHRFPECLCCSPPQWHSCDLGRHGPGLDGERKSFTWGPPLKINPLHLTLPPIIMEVEHDPIVKETSLGGTHVQLP